MLRFLSRSPNHSIILATAFTAVPSLAGVDFNGKVFFSKHVAHSNLKVRSESSTGPNGLRLANSALSWPSDYAPAKKKTLHFESYL